MMKCKLLTCDATDHEIWENLFLMVADGLDDQVIGNGFNATVKLA